MAELLLPVPGYNGLSSWQAHINRGTPSTEPGTDLYVPIGTPVFAPADGVIWGYGTSIGPATGRWVGINFFNGMSFRCMHHSQLVRTGGNVAAGELIAYSGASGYGEEDWSWNVAETGGAHTHVTLWPTHEHRYGYRSNGDPFTVDFMNYVGGFAGGDSQPFLEDDMFTDQDRANITSILTALGAGDLKPGQWSDTIMGNTRDILTRAVNLDRQVTGADGFDQPGQQSVAGRVIDIQNRPATAVTDEQIKAIADAVIAQIGTPSVSIDYAKVGQAAREAFRTDPLS